MAGSGIRDRLRAEALIGRAARPSSAAARHTARRLVPSVLVKHSWRMRARLTLRPQYRQTIARAAAPQSISSSWRTKGNRRIRRSRLTKCPAGVAKGSVVSAAVSSSSPTSTWRGPTFSWTLTSAGSISSAKSRGTRATVL